MTRGSCCTPAFCNVPFGSCRFRGAGSVAKHIPATLCP
jgi:hypothetical protein